MPASSANFGPLLAPGLRDVWGTDYNDWQPEFEDLFEVLTSEKAYEEDYSLTGLGLVPTKGEGKGINYDNIYQGIKNRYTHVTYGMGFIVTREMYEDDLYNKIREMPKGLARSDRHTVESITQNWFNGAFSTSLGGDGKALIASDHPLIAGGTFSNTPSVNADFDVTSLEQALIDIAMNYIDDRGLKIYAKPLMLACHPNNDFQAQQTLKSAGLPGTANNDINPAERILPQGHKLFHWFTDPDAWFIKTDVPKGTKFYWRRRPDFGQDTDFDSENAKYKTTFRCSFGHTDPRQWYGTAGS